MTATHTAPLQIGLTGGIGSGKSTVAAIWARHFDTAIVDADRISRQLTEAGGSAVAAIAAAFGPAMVDASGAMDRARMRQLVFEDADARRLLEAILHPLIFQGIDEAAAQAHARGQSAVLDIPLLVESRHWRARLEQIVVVDCPPELQRERVMQRSQLAASEVERIMAGQATRTQRLQAADLVLYNGAIALAELEQQAVCAARLLGLQERV